MPELQPTPIHVDTEDPWRVFKIMDELLAGFEALGKIPPAVAFFGSSRATPDDPAYTLAEKTARLLAESDYAILTGGGPGIMEAANKGATEAGSGRGARGAQVRQHLRGGVGHAQNQEVLGGDAAFGHDDGA